MNNKPTSNVDNQPDTWENRISNAAVFLGKTYEEVNKILSDFGITQEPAGLVMLSDEEITPFGDIRKIFCDDHGIPVPKLRMAMKSLRGPKNNDALELDPTLIALKNKFGYKIKLENIDTADLLPYYKPDKPNSPISIVLKKRYEHKPVIAFNPDSRDVAIEETINYITDLEMGYEEEDTIEVNGSLVRLYPIGKIPNQVIEEDPLFPGKPLKRGRSIVNRINWSAITLDVQQFCRIIVKREEIDVNDKFAVKKLIEMALKGMDELKKTFPEVDLEYRERKKEDNLPKLRLTLQEMSNNKKQDPFAIKNRQF